MLINHNIILVFSDFYNILQYLLIDFFWWENVINYNYEVFFLDSVKKYRSLDPDPDS